MVMRLGGVGRYGPEVMDRSTKEGRFGFWFPSPPAQNSIIVYREDSGRDPLVVEGNHFMESTIQHPDVDTFIRGGHYFEVPDTGYLHDVLLDAGYTLEPMP